MRRVDGRPSNAKPVWAGQRKDEAPGCIWCPSDEHVPSVGAPRRNPVNGIVGPCCAKHAAEIDAMPGADKPIKVDCSSCGAPCFLAPKAKRWRCSQCGRWQKPTTSV